MNWRKLILGLGLAGMLGLAAAIAINWNALLMEWYRQQAVQDATTGVYQSKSDSQKFAPCWEKLVAGREAGFQVLARLLLSRDSRIWTRALVVIDQRIVAGHESISTIKDPSTVIAALRERGLPTLLRFLMYPSYASNTYWREPLRRLLLEPGQEWLPPDPECMEFCAEMLQGQSGFTQREVSDLRARAVEVLFLMLWPENQELHEDKAFRLLAEFVRGAADAGLCLEVLQRLLERLGHASLDHLRLTDWEGYFRLGAPQVDCVAHDLVGESLFECPIERFLDPVELAALVRIDHPRVLRILMRLDKDPKGKAALDAALAQTIPGLPIPVPRWRPFRESALRYLSGPPRLHPGAALAMVDLGDQGCVDAINDALIQESDADRARFLRSCLLALGDGRFLREVNSWVVEDALHLAPLDDGWLVDPRVNLLRSGDRMALDSSVESLIQIRKNTSPVPLIGAIEGLPLWKFDFQECLSDWWILNRDKIRFDSAKRLWVVSP
jgi:hypothetical protein